MVTRTPSLTRILIALGFTLSCFGLALFLWVSFGGPLPLGSRGYEFNVPFDEATQLAVQSDVRISGVSVGKVTGISLGSDGLAHAEIELDSNYAPIPSDTRAILRQKTLLGETYVELSPGTQGARPLPEGGSLPAANVAKSVQLDEVFRTFRPRTRTAFQQWMQNQAVGLHGRGADLSAAIGELPPWASSSNRLLRILDTQGQAVRRLVAGGGEVFRALSEREGQLRGLVQHARTVFDTTARRNRDLAAAFRAFPTFLGQSRVTLDRLRSFAGLADPLVRRLEPSARQLGPTLTATGRLAPELGRFFDGLRGAVHASVPGFGALRSLLSADLPPVLSRLDPYLAQLDPILEVAGRYRHEITAFLANTTAATNAFNRPSETNFHVSRYLRTTNPLSPDALAVYPHRLRSNRANPYVAPGGYSRLGSGLQSFTTGHCSAGARAVLDPATALDPAFLDRTAGDPAAAQDLFSRIVQFAYGGVLDSNAVAAPGCAPQPDQRSVGVSPEFSRYLHVRRDP
jgi:virulence factor Mce-like protein